MGTAILRKNLEYLILRCNNAISHRYGDREMLWRFSVASITREE